MDSMQQKFHLDKIHFQKFYSYFRSMCLYVLPIAITCTYMIFFTFFWNILLSLYSIYLFILMLIIAAYEYYALIYHWYKCISTDQNDIPNDLYSEFININSPPNICDKCKTLKYPRTHHCNTCNQCCIRFDHHCLFMNCVGQHNVRHYFLFLFHTTFAASCLLFLLIEFAVFNATNESYNQDITIISIIFLFNILYPTAFQALLQFLFISLNVSSVDIVILLPEYFQTKHFHLPWNKGFVKNWRESLCVRDDLSVLIYLLPYTPTPKELDLDSKDQTINPTIERIEIK
ncbi:Palmitoyltransferase [Entamoeba marina]